MSMRCFSLLLLAAHLTGGLDAASAKSRHWHQRQLSATVVEPPPASYSGPTLVLHPASNIACNTPFRATRPLPCDQPVWVYGNPCEIDLGLGRYRSCY
jgi:hypothetical protein